jgi:iron complex transport system substrate-binding protein
VSPTPTEILFAVGAGDLVVGVDEYSDYPAEATNRTKVGSFTLNIEAIVGLDPDLIVSSDLVPQQQLDQLVELGYPYFIFATRDFEGVFKDIRMAGVLTWHIAEADALATSLEARVNEVALKTLAAGVTKPRTYVEYYPYYTYGPGSFGDDLIRVAGGVNIGHNLTSEYPTATSEFVVASDPQVIIYASTSNATEIASRPGWNTISAIRNGQLYSIDEDILSRYGPRIVDCLEVMAQILHPELFDS